MYYGKNIFQPIQTSAVLRFYDHCGNPPQLYHPWNNAFSCAFSRWLRQACVAIYSTWIHYNAA